MWGERERRGNTAVVPFSRGVCERRCPSEWRTSRLWRERSESVRNMWLKLQHTSFCAFIHAVRVWEAITFYHVIHKTPTIQWPHHDITSAAGKMCLHLLFSLHQAFSTFYFVSLMSLMEPLFTLAGTSYSAISCSPCSDEWAVCPYQSNSAFHLGLLLSHRAEQQLPHHDYFSLSVQSYRAFVCYYHYHLFKLIWPSFGVVFVSPDEWKSSSTLVLLNCTHVSLIMLWMKFLNQNCPQFIKPDGQEQFRRHYG